MKYLLAVLTHGRGATLDETLAAFVQNVTPQPSRILVHADGWFGDGSARRFRPTPNVSTEAHVRRAQEGFCRATGALWAWASLQIDLPFVFWLEHDFLLQRELHLDQLAAVLTEEHDLAQMALMRSAVSDEEIAAGGLYESRPGQYAPRVWFPGSSEPAGLKEKRPAITESYVWQRHRSYFTTNPSLMRSDFMRSNPWIDEGPECEGRYGIELVQRGYSFGVWGDGAPWVEHVGIRSGSGY